MGEVKHELLYLAELGVESDVLNCLVLLLVQIEVFNCLR